jgi:hypothetical protein
MGAWDELVQQAQAGKRPNIATCPKPAVERRRTPLAAVRPATPTETLPEPAIAPTRLVAHLKREPCDVRIDRGTPWGNPFELDKAATDKAGERAAVIAQHQNWLANGETPTTDSHGRTFNPVGAREHLPELKGKRLGCWCAPLPCHGDTLAALAAEVPRDCWLDYSDSARRDWVRERLGLSVRFWCVTVNGQRSLVEFVEPQTREALQEQAARNSPGERIELEPALLLPAVRDNALTPTETLPDNAPAPAGRWLEQAGVAVRYVAAPAQLEQALSELAALPDTGPWGLDIETAPLPAFRKDNKAGLDPWRSVIRLVQVYPGGATCYVFDIAALGLSPLAERLNTQALVAHNALFEWKFLLHAGAAPARLGCTLLMDNALGNGRRSLATLAAEHLGWTLDKTLRGSDWTAANLTAAQLDYAALDAVAAWRLARELSPRLKARNLTACYATRNPP